MSLCIRVSDSIPAATNAPTCCVTNKNAGRTSFQDSYYCAVIQCVGCYMMIDLLLCIFIREKRSISDSITEVPRNRKEWQGEATQPETTWNINRYAMGSHTSNSLTRAFLVDSLGSQSCPYSKVRCRVPHLLLCPWATCVSYPALYNQSVSPTE